MHLQISMADEVQDKIIWALTSALGFNLPNWFGNRG